MRRWAILAGALLAGCPSPPPRFGGGAAEGVGETGDGGGASTSGHAGSVDAGDGSGEGGSAGDGASATTGGNDGSDSGTQDCPGGTEIGSACDPTADECPACSKCVAVVGPDGFFWESFACAPVQPDAAGLGEPCSLLDPTRQSAIDDCDADSYCWDFISETGQGICAKGCTGTQAAPACADDDAVCLQDPAVYRVCRPRCNPLLQNCDAGFACYQTLFDYDLTCVPDPGSVIAPGETCTSFDSCAPGSTCSPAYMVPGCPMTSSCCSAFCDLSDSSTCLAGQSCVTLGNPPPGYESLGICDASM